MVAAGNLLRRRTGLPDTEEPDPLKAHPSQAIQLRIRNVVQNRGATQLLRKCRQPDPRVDLIERRITYRCHGLSIQYGYTVFLFVLPAYPLEVAFLRQSSIFRLREE